MKLEGKIRPHTRREIIKSLGSIGILSSLINSLNYKLAYPVDLSTKKIKEGVIKFQGDVFVNDKIINEKKIKNQNIPIDSILKTGPSSSLLFVIDKDAFLLRENTTIKLNHHKNKKRLLGFEISNGGILSVFSKKERRIRTPSALIGIKGTALYLEVDSVKTYICTCYGTSVLQVKKDLSIKETVKTNHHDEPRYIYSKLTSIFPAPVVNHTDLELIMLEELVFRKPPFLDKDGKIKESAKIYSYY